MHLYTYIVHVCVLTYMSMSVCVMRAQQVYLRFWYKLAGMLNINIHSYKSNTSQFACAANTLLYTLVSFLFAIAFTSYTVAARCHLTFACH